MSSPKNPIQYVQPSDLSKRSSKTAVRQKAFDTVHVIATDANALQGVARAGGGLYGVGRHARATGSGLATASAEEASFVYLDVGLLGRQRREGISRIPRLRPAPPAPAGAAASASVPDANASGKWKRARLRHHPRPRS